MEGYKVRIITEEQMHKLRDLLLGMGITAEWGFVQDGDYRPLLVWVDFPSKQSECYTNYSDFIRDDYYEELSVSQATAQKYEVVLNKGTVVLGWKSRYSSGGMWLPDILKKDYVESDPCIIGYHNKYERVMKYDPNFVDCKDIFPENVCIFGEVHYN